MIPGKLSLKAIEILKHGACTDAIHDFSHKMAFNKNGIHDDNKAGLPELKKGLTVIPDRNIPTGDDSKGADKWKDENEFIQAIFGSDESVLNAWANVDKPYMFRFVQNIREGINDDNNFVKNLQVVNSAEGTIDYDVKLLHKNREDADPLFDAKIFKNIMTLDDYATFFEEEGSKNVTLNILTDAQCVDIVQLIREAKQEKGGAKIKINKIINREVFNDPATKRYKTTREDSGDLMEDFLWDTEQNDIMYPANDPTNIISEPGTIHRNKFFSKFNFRLGPLLRTSDDDFISKPAVNLTVTNPEDTTWKIEKNNPNKQNTILNCVKRIVERFGKKGTNPCEISAEFQCKRSGDWLQALSCLDTSRSYISAKSGEDVSCNGQAITLVTLDRVLLAYALFMGLDVIYTWIQNDSDEEDDIVEGEEDGDEDEEGAISAVSATGRPRIILYFKRQRTIDYNKKATELYKILVDKKIGKVTEINEYIEKYNGWLDSIQTRVINEINNLTVSLKMDADLKRLHPKNCELLLQAYWRYTAIDYNNAKLDGSKMNDAFTNVDRFNKEFNKNKNDENAKLLIGAINDLSSQIDTFNNCMRNFSDENSIINANSSYLALPHYRQMIELLVERETRSTAELVKLKLIETLGRLHTSPFGLTENMFNTMIENLEYYYNKMTSVGKNLPIMLSFINHAKFLQGEKSKTIKEQSAEIALATVKDEIEKAKKMEIVAISTPEEKEKSLENIIETKAEFLNTINTNKKLGAKKYKELVGKLSTNIDSYMNIIPEGYDHDMFEEMKEIIKDVGSEMTDENIETMKYMLAEDAYVDSIEYKLQSIRDKKEEKRKQLRAYQEYKDNKNIYVALSELRHLSVLLKELEEIAKDIANGKNMDLFERKYSEKLYNSTDAFDTMFSAEWRLEVDDNVLNNDTSSLRILQNKITESALSDEVKAEMQKYLADSLDCAENFANETKIVKKRVTSELNELAETVKEIRNLEKPEKTMTLKTVVKTILDPETYLNMIGWSMRYLQSGKLFGISSEEKQEEQLLKARETIRYDDTNTFVTFFMKGTQKLAFNKPHTKNNKWTEYDVIVRYRDFIEDICFGGGDVKPFYTRDGTDYELCNMIQENMDNEQYNDTKKYKAFVTKGGVELPFNKPATNDNMWSEKDILETYRTYVEAECSKRIKPYCVNDKQTCDFCGILNMNSMNKKGGGNDDGGADGADGADYSTQFFVVMFLKQLYTTLNNFETGMDCNYILCETVVKLAIAFCGDSMNMTNVEAMFYNYLANGDWLKNDASKFMKNMNFASNVSDFARGEALETMNLLYAKNPIPSLNSVQPVLPENAVKIYTTLENSLKGRLLHERIKFMSEILYDIIKTNDGDIISTQKYKLKGKYDAKENYRVYKSLSGEKREQAFPKLPLHIQNHLRKIQQSNQRYTFKRGNFKPNTINRRTVIEAIGGRKSKVYKRVTRRKSWF